MQSSILLALYCDDGNKIKSCFFALRLTHHVLAVFFNSFNPCEINYMHVSLVQPSLLQHVTDCDADSHLFYCICNSSVHLQLPFPLRIINYQVKNERAVVCEHFVNKVIICWILEEQRKKIILMLQDCFLTYNTYSYLSSLSFEMHLTAMYLHMTKNSFY